MKGFRARKTDRICNLMDIQSNKISRLSKRRKDIEDKARREAEKISNEIMACENEIANLRGYRCDAGILEYYESES